ncbi:MAG: formylglycine-generating enzyme family protein, partial [Akkermansiaceae bacterium]|nr:formylglycine-generating enzyme family protein [Akkermansiaceae bacterium]
ANTVESGKSRVVQVGSYRRGRSPYGVYDMIGNAAEWLADYFDPDYYASSEVRDPKGPSAVLDHGLRGGSWDSTKARANTIYRNSSHSARPNSRVGFRCVVQPSP